MRVPAVSRKLRLQAARPERSPGGRSVNNNLMLEYEPFTEFREKAFRGMWGGTKVTVHEAGFREIRDQRPWPPAANRKNIFVFGGSTTFGYGVDDDQSIPSYLQQLAGDIMKDKSVAVYNFGRGYYMSTQEVVLFYRLLTNGFVPDIAIFIDGLNDLYLWDGQPAFAGVLKNVIENGNRLSWMNDVPVFKFINGLASRPVVPPDTEIPSEAEHRAGSAIQRYLANKRIIESVAAGFAVKPLLVWQPVPTYKYDLRNHVLYKGDRKVFRTAEIVARGSRIMDENRKSHDMGAHFLWLGDLQEGRHDNLYVDLHHYTGAFSKVIAGSISDFLRSANYLN
jgi:hypothetical protein